MPDERDAFRLAVALAGLVPVGAGLLGVLAGASAFSGGPHPVDVSLDSHARYLSGLLLGIGLAYWTTLKAPEAHGRLWNVLTAIVVLGGLARLLGLAVAGPPDLPMRLALGMELAVTPALWAWRRRIYGGGRKTA